MSFRYDKGTLRPPRRLANGMLRVDGLFTRSGVFEYLNSDGTVRREYRPPEEVFKQDSLETMVGIPFTDGHPPEEVTSDNAEKYTRGAVGENVRQDGNHVAGSIFAHHASVVGKLEGGTRELSLGYKIREDWTPGISPGGEQYDLVQRDIVYNHLALVTQARAGESARVRMDAAIQQEKTMKPEDKAAPADNMAEATFKVRLDALETEVTKYKARADKAEGDLAAAVKLAEETEAKVKTARDDARARLSLEASAAEVLGAEERFDGVADKAIMSKVVEKLGGKKVEETTTVEVARERFDNAMEGFRAGKSPNGDLTIKPVERQDAGTADEAYQKQIERNQNAWKAASK